MAIEEDLGTLRYTRVDKFVLAPTYQEGMQHVKADPKWIILAETNPVAISVLKKSGLAYIQILNKAYDPEWLQEAFEFITENSSTHTYDIVD